MSARNLLVTIQVLDDAQRRADPQRMTFAALREAVAMLVENRAAPGPDGRHHAYLPPAQMAEIREDPAFVAALADGEVEIVEKSGPRPRWLRRTDRSTHLALRPPA